MRSRPPALLLLLLGAAAAGCAPGATAPSGLAPPSAPVAGPYFLGVDLERALPAPGTEALAAGEPDRRRARATAPSSREAGAGEAAAAPCLRWNELTRALAAGAPLPPPAFARAYVLVSVAAADGVDAATRPGRPGLALGCVVAGAASEVLLELFPARAGVIEDALETEAALALGGGEARGAVLRGFALGRIAGREAVRRARRDGSSAAWTGSAPGGDGKWTGSDPVLPNCGAWRTWIASSGAEFAPEPPYAFGSAEDLADVAAVIAAAAARTPGVVAAVHAWGDVSPPVIWNGLLNERIVMRDLPAGAAARAQAWLNMAMADAFVTCWAAKYRWWVARPFQRIPDLVTVLPTPNFPSYTSGHATVSAAAAAVLGEVFPGEAPHFRVLAGEAARSRLDAGIHFPHDNAQGLDSGFRLGARVVARMRDAGPRALALAARE